MGAYFRRLTWVLSWVLLVATPLGQTAAADEVVMPFACAVQDGGVRLTPAPEKSYEIPGAREERIFADCRSGPGAGCHNVMVHKFDIVCAGEKVAWASVAEAARAHGVELPDALPKGFAPAAALRARFIFPALAKFGGYEKSLVESEVIPADSVRDATEFESDSGVAGWQTEIRADAVPQGAGGFHRVALAIAGLMLALLGVSAFAAGRLTLPRYGLFERSGELKKVARRISDFNAAASDWFRSNYAAGFARSEAREAASLELLNAIAATHARIAEADMHVATLAQGLLLREVLSGELDRVRERLTSIESDLERQSQAKSAAGIRALLRELERIGRIAHGATHDAKQDLGGSSTSEIELPRSLTEAYRVLGINADAAPQVAKKLVDALRMSWHPDHARDEMDRVQREARIKQINAAWDLIKERPQQAA